MSKKIDEDRAFEQALKGKLGWKCSCSLNIVDKESSLHSARCKSCGKIFKTNRDTDLCFKCEKTVKK